MKLIKSIFLILLFSTVAFAQKKTIAITSFETTSNTISTKYVKAIEDKVKEAFYSTNRFNIVDRTNYEKLIEEKELQKTEDFMDGTTVKQANLEGAEQIVTASISQVDIVKTKTETSFYYDCKISFSLQVIDILTGQVVASELIRPKQDFMSGLASKAIGGDNTEEKSFFNSLKGTQKAIDKFVSNHFPVTTLIIEISDATASKAKSVLINFGSLKGAKKNQEFNVIELVVIKVENEDLIRRKELGKIKITKVEGDKISEAKVVKGGEAILAKFNAGAKIECYSKTK